MRFAPPPLEEFLAVPITFFHLYSKYPVDDYYHGISALMIIICPQRVITINVTMRQSNGEVAATEEEEEEEAHNNRDRFRYILTRALNCSSVYTLLLI